MHPPSEIGTPAGDDTGSLDPLDPQAKAPTPRPLASKLRNRLLHPLSSSSSQHRTLRGFLRLPGPPPTPSTLPSGSATAQVSPSPHTPLFSRLIRRKRQLRGINPNTRATAGPEGHREGWLPKPKFPPIDSPRCVIAALDGTREREYRFVGGGFFIWGS